MIRAFPTLALWANTYAGGGACCLIKVDLDSTP